jgi:hypothetical protein
VDSALVEEMVEEMVEELVGWLALELDCTSSLLRNSRSECHDS